MKSVVVTCAVEGDLDSVVARRLLAEVGAAEGRVYILGGKQKLHQRLPAYNRAAKMEPWLVLVDLDRDECAPRLRQEWLADQSPNLCLRIAVRAMEAWLLADREAFADFFGVSPARIPAHPDEVQDPKRLVVDLARRSRRRAIREDLVPREGSGRAVGPAYTSWLIEFADRVWRPREAAGASASLRRCIAALQAYVARATASRRT